MKGHFRKRGNKWCFILDLGCDHNGDRKQKWFSGFKTKKEAEQESVKIMSQIQTGTYIEPNKTTLSEFLDHWLRTIKSKVVGKTHERYKEICDLNIKPRLGKVTLIKLQPSHINDLYSFMLESGRKKTKGGLSKRTVHHTHRIFKEAMGHAVKWQLLVRNPCDAVDPPRPDKNEQLTFTTEETMDLLNSCKGTRLYIPVLLAVTTGLRRGEVMGLRWKDIDLDNGRLSVRQVAEELKGQPVSFKEPKTQKGSRMISLPSVTVKALKQYRAEQAKLFLQLGKGLVGDSLVFDTPLGLYTPEQLTSEYRRFIKAHKLKHVTFHGLRHTHATQLLEQNIHPKIVSERLGHSTIAITLDTYSHVLPNMQDGVASVTDKLFKGV